MAHENYLSNITNTHFPLESKDLKLLEEEKVQALPLLSSKIYCHIPKCQLSLKYKGQMPWGRGKTSTCDPR